MGAHLDDTTGYQVYHNVGENAASTTAVKETSGILLTHEGEPAQNYYYSTSCGFGSDEHVWRSETAPELFYLTARSVSRDGYEGADLVYTADSMRGEAMFAQFLLSPPETDFEKEEPWYRWSYEVSGIDSEKILKISAKPLCGKPPAYPDLFRRRICQPEAKRTGKDSKYYRGVPKCGGCGGRTGD